MRFTSLMVDGFRAFGTRHTFDLDAEAIVLVGANGQGKTSLFDAILWALSGLLPRLGEEPEVVSLYSKSGEARVELELSTEGGSLRILRHDPGGLSLEYRGERFEGDRATPKLHELLWPGAASASDGAAAFTGALTRSVYLQQDLIRGFIETDDDQARFRAVSELAGTGRVTELSLSLERAKIAWSKATNVKARELEEARERLELRTIQLNSLGSFEVGDEGERVQRWSEWWEVAARIGVGRETIPTLGGDRSANALDEALREMVALRGMLERQLSLGESLRSALTESPKPKPPDIPKLRERAERIAGEVIKAEEELQAAERRAAEARRRAVERREAAEELSSLAELALRHIHGPCPVCEQAHHVEHTEEHLRRLIERAGVSAEVPDTGPSVATLAANVARLEADHSAVQGAVRSAEAAEREATAERAGRDAQLKELGLEGGEPTDIERRLSALLGDARRRRDQIDAHEADGERLSVELARAAEEARHAELQATIAADRAVVAELEKLVAARGRTGELGGKILEALRDASSEVVTAQLEGVSPLLQRIYATTDPHPSFRAVRLLPRFSRGRGRLNTALDDSLGAVSIDRPEAILSSSQLNALAVSLFLTLNLGLPSVPLPVAILDDPLQSLDDVNLLGLVDLLRRTKAQRQLFVSTHDRRFADLLARKLRPVEDGERTRVIELGAWSREGPSIEESDFKPDPERMRIAV
jgi:exonuclease SbcC